MNEVSHLVIDAKTDNARIDVPSQQGRRSEEVENETPIGDLRMMITPRAAGDQRINPPGQNPTQGHRKHCGHSSRSDPTADRQKYSWMAAHARSAHHASVVSDGTRFMDALRERREVSVVARWFLTQKIIGNLQLTANWGSPHRRTKRRRLAADS
jgi:hypothetical protein